MEIEAVGLGSEWLSAILALYRANVNTLGFMPQGGFQSRAASGTLLVATETSSLYGYLLYDLPEHHIAIRHLCVRATDRGKGTARRLVQALVDRHPERHGILLSCRKDFPAADLWPRLDFEPVSEFQGRSREGHLLTRWWRDFEHPTLFTADTEAVGPALTAALDTDVFLDLVTPEGRPIETMHLLDDWVSERAELFITKEIPVEVREQTRRKSGMFRRRDAPATVWEPIADRLRFAATAQGRGPLSDHDQRDVRHISRAAAVGASFFVTRDEKLIRRFRAVAGEAGVELVTPGEFTARLDAPATYAPVMLENTSFSLSPAAKFPVDELVARFLNYGAGEKAYRLRARLRETIADRAYSTAWVVADEREQPVALYAQRIGPASLEVTLLRAVGPMASTLSRHVAHMQRQRAMHLGLPEARVSDDMLSASFHAALAAEGYRYDVNGWRATPRRGLLPVSDIGAAGGPLVRHEQEIAEMLSSVVDDARFRPGLAADLERELAPLKLLGAGIRSYLVPIKSHWAAELFDSALSRATLFGRDPALGISREHVYYSGALHPPRTPARIVWYVSGAAPRGGPGAVRAVSTLEEAVVDRPGTLYRRYQHLGVWKRDEVLATARNGKALALRFSDTELFANPISLAELRTLSEDARHTLFLRSVAELPEHLFASIYERGIDGHD